MSVPLRQAIDAVIQAKTLGNRRQRYVDGLRLYLNQFARGRESQLLGELDVGAIEQWFTTRRESLTTRASNIGRLSALFSFGVRRKWIAENPCRQLERITIERTVPRILTPAESERLMRWAQFEKPEMVGYLAKSLFVGIRPEEADRLQPDRIDEGNGLIIIDAAASKVRNRRIIELQPAAVEWLAQARKLGCLDPVHLSTRRRWIKDARAHLGFTSWPQDILRHSAASYLMATVKNANLVAEWLGNSADILRTHYRELVSAEDAAAFWGIRP